MNAIDHRTSARAAWLATAAVLFLVALPLSGTAWSQTCNIPAVSSNLGGGCGAPTPVLTVTPPALGSTLQITIDSDFPQAPVLLFVTLGPATPIPIPFGPGQFCVLHIDPFNFVAFSAFTNTQGDKTFSFPIPNIASLAGIELTFQARVWADTGVFSGDNFSNGVFARVGCNDLGQIGDTVFCDNDDNGVQDPGDPGIPGVTVNLSCASGYTATAVTDADGKYLFNNIAPNDACTVTVDPTTVPADKDPGTNCPETFTVTLAPSQSFLDADFCYVNTGEIGDTVYCDNDDNGVQDPGDPGIPGVTVTLSCANGFTASMMTDANGEYLFQNLPAGVCTVTVNPATAPADKVPGTNCPLSFNVPLAAGQSFLDADFCFVNTGEIGDTVFCDSNDNGVQDPGEPGIPGVSIALSCVNGLSATAVTDANGEYLFDNIPAGACTVTVDPATAPADKVPGQNCPLSFNVPLAAGQSFLDADFCFVNTGEIGDTVFCDTNDNGVQDPGEPGIPGVNVALSCLSGLTASATTDGNGEYLFTNIPAGSCTVTVDPASAPADKIPGTNCPLSVSVMLAVGQSFLDADFCFINTGEIGDTVFCDTNNNGIQDPGEPGIPGVNIALSCANGVTAAATTDANGEYLFQNLAPGSCTVTVDPATAPADKVPGVSCPLSFTIMLAAGQSFLDADFCFVNTGQIGDTVFCDLNDNGIQDGGEPGIAGVTVNLSCNGGFTASQVTDGSGHYLFTNLAADTCTVTVDPSTVPADKVPGTNCPATFTVPLLAGQSFLDADFCYVPTGEIGDTVFCDLNNDGIQDPGEPGLQGLTVTLTCQTSGLTATAITDSNGQYLFTNLLGGENCSVVVDPTTAPFDKVPGPNCPTDILVALAPGQSFLDADFCFVICGECDGKVNALTLRYLGTVQNAMIQVQGGAIFSGIVQPGGVFSFNGTGFQSDGTLGTSINITVDGGTATNIHTSCSQPIGPGQTFGDFEILAGTSRNGGALCPLQTCDFGKPCALTLLYTGESCAATSHTQDPDKVNCSGDPQFAPQVMILSTDDEDPAANDPLVWFSGIVDLNTTFTIQSLIAGESRLKSATFVHIFSLQGNLLQTIEFHTSCSQPLHLGDQFGSVRLVDFTPEGQCPLAPGVDACDVLGSPQVITMQYTGESCAATSHSQAADKVTCTGDPNMAPLVDIRASDKANPTDSGALVWFMGSVPLNGTYDIDATMAGQSKLKSNTFIHIFDPSTGSLLQTVMFHTSCSQPLELGNQFGASLLVGYIGDN